MRKLTVIGLLVGSLLAAYFSGAADGAGRLLLSMGFPGLAATLISDPNWKGVALYAGQRWTEAADAFRRSNGPGSAYNLGNALAQAGQYAQAIQSYDDALARDPTDEDAETNRAIVEALMRAEVRSPKTPGPGAANAGATHEGKSQRNGSENSEAQSSGGQGRAGSREVSSAAHASGARLIARSSTAGRIDDSGNGGAGGLSTGSAGSDSSAQTLLENPARFETKADPALTHPDKQWLQTLPDDPAQFLKLRLASENARRVEAGTAPPITGDPW